MFLRRLYVLLGLCKFLRARGQINQVSYSVKRITNLMHHLKRELAGKRPFFTLSERFNRSFESVSQPRISIPTKWLYGMQPSQWGRGIRYSSKRHLTPSLSFRR